MKKKKLRKDEFKKKMKIRKNDILGEMERIRIEKRKNIDRRRWSRRIKRGDGNGGERMES